MGAVVDRVGEQFGSLTVVSRAANNRWGAAYWLCRCHCGGERVVKGERFSIGKRFSCGAAECRFWEKVEIGLGVDDCWLWIGATCRGGYGNFYPSQSGFMNAHVYSFELHGGVLGVRDGVLHHCDNPPCVRPSHLFSGTQADNVRDMLAKGRGAYQ